LSWRRRGGNTLAAGIYCSYVKSVKITYDPAKRDATLTNRGLDFDHAGAVFEGPHATAPDARRDYGEARNITAGLLAGRLVVVVWTPRDGTRRIISMRYANEREAERWRQQMERPG
jgi:uncharacterized DUF497 family protein